MFTIGSDKSSADILRQCGSLIYMHIEVTIGMLNWMLKPVSRTPLLWLIVLIILERNVCKEVSEKACYGKGKILPLELKQPSTVSSHVMVNRGKLPAFRIPSMSSDFEMDKVFLLYT